MEKRPRKLRNLVPALATVLFLMASCSHSNLTAGGGGNSSSPMILTFHDTPPAGITVTSFQVTITGAVLQPGNISLLPSSQTIELTQLQANSAVLSVTNVAPASYTGLMVTYANPKYTFLNDSGGSLTVGGQTCAAGASCVIANAIVSASSLSLSGKSPFPLIVGANQQTLVEVDVNLNDIIQPDFSLNFAKSGAATVQQQTAPSGAPSVIGSFTASGAVTSANAGAKQFTLAASSGQSLTIGVSGTAIFNFQRANCAANNFTCLAAGQIVNTSVNILTNGSFQASEVDFDDKANTQQVTGAIVSFSGTPPTNFQMIVHNTIPVVSNLSVGTPVTVNIGSGTSFLINNGSLSLSAGAVFASNSDLLVGQEVEARVKSGTIISGGAFTTDRLALEPAQITATVASISPGANPPLFILSQLPALFSQAATGSVSQIRILISPSTTFQQLPTPSLSGLTVGQPASAGGFLFNTTGTNGSPTIEAVTVRGAVPGT